MTVTGTTTKKDPIPEVPAADDSGLSKASIDIESIPGYLTGAADGLRTAMYVSMFINTLFPLNFINKLVFLRYTGRQVFGLYDTLFIVQLILTYQTLTWIYDWYRLQTPIEDNRFIKAFKDNGFDADPE